ncbi:Transmembrane protein 117 [Labeo rohita]|uniref:Transmembrane protein 117 n=1 Tax=Labeo rohita TaxID=84645 RepID=A0ABQ8LDU5_LABRO|nr:Transmembrane protein 117 [Labeo rohita]
MMLQDTHYPDWGRTARHLWDNLNRGFLPSDEVSRAFLASFILVFDLLIVMQCLINSETQNGREPSGFTSSFISASSIGFTPRNLSFISDPCVRGASSVTHVCWLFLFQDWEFPHFMGDLDMNLPGLSTTQLKIRLPVCKRIFKDEYHIHITGKWFNYGIIFLVLILDLNMWKNQIFYKPYEYGQYVGPGEKIYTVEDPETLRDFNRSTLTWEWRSTNIDPRTNRTYVQRDMFLHSRYVGSSLDVKCLAFIPSLAAFVLFGFFIWLFGRFQDSETFPENQDKTYERIKRKSPSDLGVTPEEVHITMSEALKRSGTPMLLLVDTHHFGSSNNSMSPCSNETQETQPSVAVDSGAHEDTADVKKLTP